MLRLVRCLLAARKLVPDASLVALPPGVQRCEVYRNLLTLDEEERIYEELSQVLQKEGDIEPHPSSTAERKVIKQIYMDMFGEKEFTEVKSLQRKEVRRLPGLRWSPTLQVVLREVSVPLIGVTPDTARVVEYSYPGYEMHVEHPTVGGAFLYFNLLSATVLNFDDEASQRTGQVYLPPRALMVVSGEARWGFRFGEAAEEEYHTFVAPSGTTREVPVDLRMSVQLWKFSPNLLDQRILQERVEENIGFLEKAAKEHVGGPAKTPDEEATSSALIDSGSTLPVNPAAGGGGKKSSPEQLLSFLTTAHKKESGGGVLGGEMGEAEGGQPATPRRSEKEVMAEVGEKVAKQKGYLAGLQSVMSEMKAMEESGVMIDNAYLQRKIKESALSDPARDEAEGFDPENIEKSWDNVDAKAQFYRNKLRSMDYDGTAFLNSRMPDLSEQTPLDMRNTIRKLTPFVKDGEKVVASFPSGPGER